MPYRLLAALSCLLLACGDDRGAGGPAQRPRVFFTSFSRGLIDAFTFAPSGDATPGWTFATSGHPLDLAHDSLRDTLYVLRETGVLALAGAGSGAVTSERTFTVHGNAMALDAEHDVLYVGAGMFFPGGPPARVLVFEDVSTLSGDVMPDRTLSLPASGVTDLAVDGARGRLYVTAEVEGVEGSDALFALSLDAAAGAEAQMVVASFPQGTWLTTLALDAARDRLYVNLPAESNLLSVVAVDGASTLPGGPVSWEEVPGLPLVAGPGCFLDHDPYTDTLYLLAGDHVVSVASASAAGAAAPAVVWNAWPWGEYVDVSGATHAAFAP